jgi:hypothetical protein
MHLTTRREASTLARISVRKNLKGRQGWSWGLLTDDCAEWLAVVLELPEIER